MAKKHEAEEVCAAGMRAYLALKASGVRIPFKKFDDDPEGEVVAILDMATLDEKRLNSWGREVRDVLVYFPERSGKDMLGTVSVSLNVAAQLEASKTLHHGLNHDWPIALRVSAGDEKTPTGTFRRYSFEVVK